MRSPKRYDSLVADLKPFWATSELHRNYLNFLYFHKYLILLTSLIPLIRSYTFWMGDLNFRLDGLNFDQITSTIKQAASRTSATQRDSDFGGLLAHDQLKKAIREGKAFEKFNEAPITFAPTFKFVVGTDEYNK